ncbi:MAG: AMP-binding protein [Armatimonadetes bacterium]|nr:AMP-binding protein [Armatimonadota bacterium]
MYLTSFGSLWRECVKRKRFIDPNYISEEVWEDIEWDYLNHQERSFLLTRIVIPVIEKAKNEELYKEAYKNINVEELKNYERVEDILIQLPILFKDNTSFGARGLRHLAEKKPQIMKHGRKEQACEIFRSSGSKGIPTPTYITTKDIKLESHALGFRCFIPGGFDDEDRLYSTYNLAHKGGRLIQFAGRCIGMEVIARRPEDNLEEVVNMISSYKVNTLAAVQPPIIDNDSSAKGGGVTFLSLYKENFELFGEKGIIKKAFITGFPIPESIINLAKSINLKLFTTYGCTEFLPLATSTIEGDKCLYNDQHILYAPHIIMLVKESNGKLVNVSEGERGMVIVSTIGITEGRTIYLNYALGDTALFKYENGKCSCGRTTPIISDIKRTDHPGELLGGGCRYV